MNKKINKIYLDHAAATPVDEKVLLKMRSFWSKDFGNPGSIHSSGLIASKALGNARKDIAMAIGAKADEIIFTSGGTESDNMAVLGVANFFKRVGQGKKLHIITTKIEHHAVLKPVKFLEVNGFEVTYIPVSKNGIVNVSDVKKAIKDNTVLISVMYANNEVGTIQPIREIGNMIRNIKGDRVYPIFHTDACQAPGSLSLQVSNLGVDLMTICGSKIYGPKGSGVLYVKNGTPLDPIIFGGEQEKGFRSGTQNVPAIIGFAEALKIADERRKKDSDRLIKLRDYFIALLKKDIPEIELNGDQKMRLPNNINIYIPKNSGEQLVIELDVKGIMVSTGSACSSREEAPSHVLMSMFEKRERAESSLRFSLGRNNTKTEIIRTVRALKEIIGRLRKIPY